MVFLPEINALDPTILQVFLLLFLSFFTVSGNKAIVGKYGETVEVPCDKGNIKIEDITIVKWKYVSIFPNIRSSSISVSQKQ